MSKEKTNINNQEVKLGNISFATGTPSVGKSNIFKGLMKGIDKMYKKFEHHSHSFNRRWGLSKTSKEGFNYDLICGLTTSDYENRVQRILPEKDLLINQICSYCGKIRDCENEVLQAYNPLGKNLKTEVKDIENFIRIIDISDLQKAFIQKANLGIIRLYLNIECYNSDIINNECVNPLEELIEYEKEIANDLLPSYQISIKYLNKLYESNTLPDFGIHFYPLVLIGGGCSIEKTNPIHESPKNIMFKTFFDCIFEECFYIEKEETDFLSDYEYWVQLAHTPSSAASRRYLLMPMTYFNEIKGFDIDSYPKDDFEEYDNELRNKLNSCINNEGKWGDYLDPNASDDEIEQFFAHIDLCDYHRKIVEREDESISEFFQTIQKAIRSHEYTFERKIESKQESWLDSLKNFNTKHQQKSNFLDFYKILMERLNKPTVESKFFGEFLSYSIVCVFPEYITKSRTVLLLFGLLSIIEKNRAQILSQRISRENEFSVRFYFEVFANSQQIKFIASEFQIGMGVTLLHISSNFAHNGLEIED